MAAENLLLTWDEPVYVHVPMYSPQIIHDPREALAFLTADWAGSRDKHEFAREICSAAILGQVSSETAREVFVEAAVAARKVGCTP
ncbi:DUF982 domain-containing protein [Rhizobium sp. BK376]|jgi:hypothetical protein|uniref:DUF982 domain-containing protein n=1 Tax=Rhizobium sp. BK376 TaxID=2512149 RepID=UPI001042B3C9|nr:DUF982 domain-containing protein [Rhizobium sp. BK376]TCR68962.1 uncharacterized protein DUF982 [Rhizobium sp. BK376]